MIIQSFTKITIAPEQNVSKKYQKLEKKKIGLK